jgi:hypothetical protein
VPSTATPIVPPTVRIAMSTAEPMPARSGDSAPIAASIADGSAKPRPAPTTAIHAAAKP